MYHIKINKKRKLIIFKEAEKMTDEFDEIEKLGSHYSLVKYKDKLGSGFEQFVFDTNNNKLTGPFNYSIYSIYDTYFIAGDREFYYVYNIVDLSLKLTIKKVQNCYNFRFINEDVYVLENSLFLGNGELLCLLDSETELYNSGNYQIFKTTLKNIFILKYSIRYIYFEEENLNHQEIKKIGKFNYKIERGDAFFITYNDTTSIYINSKSVFKGIIDFDNFNIYNPDMHYFISGKDTYFLFSNEIYGPYLLDLDIVNISLNTIYFSRSLTVFLFQNFLLIFDRNTNKMSISKISIKLKSGRNQLNLFDETIQELCDIENDQIYYFNSINNNLTRLKSNKTIMPYIISNNLLYINRRHEECMLELDNNKYSLIDYTYFMDNLYYIVQDGDSYIVKNVNKIPSELKLNNKPAFSGNASILVKIRPDASVKSEFYTLSEDISKFVKPPFKVIDISHRLVDYPLSRIDFSSKDETNKLFEVNSEFPFYTTK